MDALMLRVMLIAITLFISTGAGFRTRNFVVTASTPEEAKAVAEAAEEYRRRLAIFWTGRPLRNWSRPCTIRVRSGSYGAAGQTTFQFVGGEVLNWKMMVQGSPERILDSVLPHEVNHTIFASHFRRPLPRWADEGASTLFEHRSEQMIQLELLQNVVRNQREFIPLRRLLSMKQYPSGHRPMLILYAEGFGLVDFLMQQGGRETYLRFLTDAKNGHWEAAIRQHYNHKGIEALEKDWRSWVMAGMPRYGESPEQMIASLDTVMQGVARPVSENRSETRPVTNQPDTQPAPTARRQDRSVSPDAAAGSAPRQLASFDQNRRFTLEAPAPKAAKSPRSRRRSQHAQSSKSPQEEKDFPPTPFQQETSLQPTHHQSQSETDRRHAGFGLLWERSEETGSTPQWAGFPGQTELF